MTLDMDKERREFEEQYRKVYSIENEGFFKRVNDRTYLYSNVEHHYQGWLLAKRSMSTQEAGTAPADAAAIRDAARIDWLEAQINAEGAIHLHDGTKPYGNGLGLRPGTVRRSLREAIDAALQSSKQEEKGAGE
jgi:hypothetical protein